MKKNIFFVMCVAILSISNSYAMKFAAIKGATDDLVNGVWHDESRVSFVNLLSHVMEIADNEDKNPYFAGTPTRNINEAIEVINNLANSLDKEKKNNSGNLRMKTLLEYANLLVTENFKEDYKIALSYLMESVYNSY